jgi:hypothetical protein
MGCHQLIPGQKTSLMAMARFWDAQGNCPQSLTEGRVLIPMDAALLRNPSLSRTTTATAWFVSAGAHAHVLFFGKRARQIGAFLPEFARQPFPYIPEEALCRP